MNGEKRVFPEETRHWEWFWFALAHEKIAHLDNHRGKDRRQLGSLVTRHDRLHGYRQTLPQKAGR